MRPVEAGGGAPDETAGMDALRERLEKIKRKQQETAIGGLGGRDGGHLDEQEDGDAGLVQERLRTSTKLGLTQARAGPSRALVSVAPGGGPKDGISRPSIEKLSKKGVASCLALQAAAARGQKDKKKKRKGKKDKALSAQQTLLGGKRKRKKKKKGDKDEGGDPGGSDDSTGEDSSVSSDEEKASSEDETKLLPPLKKKSDREARVTGRTGGRSLERVGRRRRKCCPLAARNQAGDLLAQLDPKQHRESTISRRARVVLVGKLHRPSPCRTTRPAGGRPRGSMAGPRAGEPRPRLVRGEALGAVFSRTPDSGRVSSHAGGQEVWALDGEGHGRGREEGQGQQPPKRQRRSGLAESRALAGEEQRKRKEGQAEGELVDRSRSLEEPAMGLARGTRTRTRQTA